jgi:Plasmid pRiA4b ORF-3-like protein
MPSATVGPKQRWSWQLKIELLGVAPTVWRRLVVPETIKLPKLHLVFQTAFGWANSHLHEFIIGGIRYANTDPDFTDELEQIDERRVILSKALGQDARCFDYVYDFGDDWHHVVIVEDRHGEHDGYLEWVGGRFDPKRFALDATNLALSKIKV